MVLQRDMPIRIWGFASPGEKVTVRFGGETAGGVTDDNGIWMVLLSPKKAGGPYTMDINGINHVWLKDIMIGDVWICAGGRQMEMPAGRMTDTGMVASAGDIPIRRFHVPLRYEYKAAKRNVTSRWEAVSASGGSLPAAGWLFAREVYGKYHVPIGLIDATAADAPAEAWLSPSALRRFPELANAAARYEDSSWAEGSGPADKLAPGGLYGGMLAPIALYTVRGVLWWQGESNIRAADKYGSVFPTLIKDWREHSGQNDLPFLYVQMEGKGSATPWGPAPAGQQAQESRWAVLREAQRMALGLPGTGMAVAADLGTVGEGDQRKLEEICRRLFLTAESVAYGKKNIIYTGPLYQSMKAHGEKVHLLFNEVNTGLIVKGGGTLKGFAIAGTDGHWFPAKAETDGKKVIVWSDSVAKPVEVRYGWADNPEGINLFNRDILFKDGLPAPPFAGHVK
jgi:sialate O-acetylesterase